MSKETQPRRRYNHKLWGLPKDAYKHLRALDAIVLMKLTEGKEKVTCKIHLTSLEEMSEKWSEVCALPGTLWSTKLGTIKRVVLNGWVMYHNVMENPTSPMPSYREQMETLLRELGRKMTDRLKEEGQVMCEALKEADILDLAKVMYKDIKKYVHKREEGTPLETRELPPSLLAKEVTDGERVISRKIDNANARHVSGEIDQEVQELPLYIQEPHTPQMGQRWRPVVERVSDRVPFCNTIRGNYWKYKQVEVDADLLGELRLEAAFQVRSHALCIHLKQRARRHLQKFDLRAYTRLEVWRMVLNTVAAAMQVCEEESKAYEIIKRNYGLSKEYNKLFASWKAPSN